MSTTSLATFSSCCRISNLTIITSQETSNAYLLDMETRFYALPTYPAEQFTKGDGLFPDFSFVIQDHSISPFEILKEWRMTISNVSFTVFFTHKQVILSEHTTSMNRADGLIGSHFCYLVSHNSKQEFCSVPLTVKQLTETWLLAPCEVLTPQTCGSTDFAIVTIR